MATGGRVPLNTLSNKRVPSEGRRPGWGRMPPPIGYSGFLSTRSEKTGPMQLNFFRAATRKKSYLLPNARATGANGLMKDSRPPSTDGVPHVLVARSPPVRQGQSPPSLGAAGFGPSEP